MPFVSLRSHVLLPTMLIVGVLASGCSTISDRPIHAPPASDAANESPPVVVAVAEPVSPPAGAPPEPTLPTKAAAKPKPKPQPKPASTATPAATTGSSARKLPSVQVAIPAGGGSAAPKPAPRKRQPIARTPAEILSSAASAPASPARAANALTPSADARPAQPAVKRTLPPVRTESVPVATATAPPAPPAETPAQPSEPKPAPPRPADRAPIPVAAAAPSDAAAKKPDPKPSAAPAPAPVVAAGRDRVPPPAAPIRSDPPIVAADPPPLSESERLALAAMPLPKLPRLAGREAEPRSTLPSAVPAAPVAPGAPVPVTTAAAADDATALLRRAADRTGLGDLELARVARYEAMIGRGEREAAIEGLAQLNAELDAAVRKAVVAPGENLRAFAGRPDIYANAALWPLIWRANIEQLPEPWAVQRDQVLAVPSYPALNDIAAAIRYAESHPQDVVRPESR